jgi:hypothetical protein
MRKVLVVALVAGALGLGLAVSRGTSAPPSAEQSVRWEHAELIESVFGHTTWVTAKDEIEAEHMKDLADRLNAPLGKEEGSSAHHRMRVMDKLSADGWEVVEYPTLNRKDPVGGSYIWSFRRRLP